MAHDVKFVQKLALSKMFDRYLHVLEEIDQIPRSMIVLGIVPPPEAEMSKVRVPVHEFMEKFIWPEMIKAGLAPSEDELYSVKAEVSGG